MTEPVDLDALVGAVDDITGEVIDHSVFLPMRDEARELKATIRKVETELRELRAKKSTIFEAITTRGQLALEELENLRAWKARLGPPESWFPGLLENDPPGPGTDAARQQVVEQLFSLMSFRPDQIEDVFEFAKGIFSGADELQTQARALLERAKETTP